MHKKPKEKEALEALLKVSKKVSSSLELEKVSDMILYQAKSVLCTDHSALFLLDEESKHLFLIGAKGFADNQIKNLAVLGSWEGINVELIKKSKPIIVNDIQRSAKFKHAEIPFLHKKLPIGAFLAVPLKTDSKIIGALLVSNHKKRRRDFTEDDKKLLSTLANNVSIALLNAKLHNNLKSLFMNTVTSLVTAVDAKDPYTHGHSERVARYAVRIGVEMNLSKDFLEDLRLSGLMHDIGKIGIKDNILSKDKALNKKELKEIREHPTIGLRIVDSVISSKVVLSGIAEHHEYYNGKGYPKRLKGKHISMEGRIIAVADAFDTLTTDRPYQKAYSAKEAALEISRSSRSQFDPHVVKAFQKTFSKNPNIWQFK
ncbi:MAG: HD domain-containing protein [Candidatus Omnitrophica bacterium]|nr:HD domain-containing protein [Candidatus Omnitrophota bacterium]